jgi:hypothetical protein
MQGISRGFVSSSGIASLATSAAASLRTAIAMQVAREALGAIAANKQPTVNYTNDSTTPVRNMALVAIKASLALATKTTHCDTIIEATTAGVAGDLLTIAFAADGAGAGSITRVGTNFTFHFADGVTTVTNFQTAVAALAGADDLIGVKTNGTGANVLTAAADVFAATALDNGADGVGGWIANGAVSAVQYAPVYVDASVNDVSIISINTDGATWLGSPVVIANPNWTAHDVYLVSQSTTEPTLKKRLYLRNDTSVKIPPGHAVALINDGNGWFQINERDIAP